MKTPVSDLNGADVLEGVTSPGLEGMGLRSRIPRWVRGRVALRATPEASVWTFGRTGGFGLMTNGPRTLEVAVCAWAGDPDRSRV